MYRVFPSRALLRISCEALRVGQDAVDTNDKKLKMVSNIESSLVIGKMELQNCKVTLPLFPAALSQGKLNLSNEQVLGGRSGAADLALSRFN